MRLFHFAFAFSLSIAGSWAFAAPNAENGKQLYAQHCAACHSAEYNGIGPLHAGVFGRKAGSVPSFTYSPAVKASSVVWGTDTLSQWLADPEALIPGQKMWMKVEDANARQDLVAYLKTLAKSK